MNETFKIIITAVIAAVAAFIGGRLAGSGKHGNAGDSKRAESALSAAEQSAGGSAEEAGRLSETAGGITEGASSAQGLISGAKSGIGDAAAKLDQSQSGAGRIESLLAELDRRAAEDDI